MKQSSLDTLLFDPQEFAFLTNTTFRGITITERPGGWNIVLRSFLKDGSAVYAMTEAADPHEGLSRLLAVLATTTGSQLWHHDRYFEGRD